jgi:hypothetical protein
MTGKHVTCDTEMILVEALVTKLRYYFEYKMHILHIFSSWKIEVRLKFEECTPF